MLILSVVSSFQLYGMPIFDGIESIYTSRMKQPCPWWFRAISRVTVGFFCFFSATAISFYGSQLQGLSGGFSLPLTLAFPCFMWITIKKPEAYSPMWGFNWTLVVWNGSKWDFDCGRSVSCNCHWYWCEIFQATLIEIV